MISLDQMMSLNIADETAKASALYVFRCDTKFDYGIISDRFIKGPIIVPVDLSVDEFICFVIVMSSSKMADANPRNN